MRHQIDRHSLLRTRRVTQIAAIYGILRSRGAILCYQMFNNTDATRALTTGDGQEAKSCVPRRNIGSSSWHLCREMKEIRMNWGSKSCDTNRTKVMQWYTCHSFSQDRRPREYEEEDKDRGRTSAYLPSRCWENMFVPLIITSLDDFSCV